MADIDSTLLIRHTLATLAYRATRVLENAPSDFGDYSCAEGVMTPKAMMAHLSMLMGFANSKLTGADFAPAEPADWTTEVDRFFDALAKFDEALSGSGVTSDEATTLKMFQGPVLDALTHVGQLALMRRASGSPVARDNYIKADIQTGRVGRDQSPPAASGRG